MVHGALLSGRHADVPSTPPLLLLPALLDRACAGVWARPSPPFRIKYPVHQPMCACTLSCTGGLTVGHTCLPHCHLCMHGTVWSAGGKWRVWRGFQPQGSALGSAGAGGSLNK